MEIPNRKRLMEMLQGDWVLMVVALGIALVLWWNITQRETVRRFFPGVEVIFQNLDPALQRITSTRTPRVSVFVQGPKAILEAVDSNAFVMVADLADIKSATKVFIDLKPNNLIPNPSVRALTANMIKVRQEDISPSRLEVETIWNSTVARIVPRISGKPASGYILWASSVTPATLTIAGSEAELERHKIIRNKIEIVLNGEKQMPDQLWDLDDLDIGDVKVLNLAPNQPIRFRMMIEPIFMKQEFQQVAVRVQSATEETRNYDIEPNLVRLFVQGARAKVSSVTHDSLALMVSLTDLPSGEHRLDAKRLPVVGLPNDCQILAVTPSQIFVRIWEPIELRLPPIRIRNESTNPVLPSNLTAPATPTTREVRTQPIQPRKNIAAPIFSSTRTRDFLLNLFPSSITSTTEPLDFREDLPTSIPLSATMEVNQ